MTLQERREKFKRQLYEDFISCPSLDYSQSYKKYLNGNTCISKHIAIWIAEHPGEPIYVGEVIHHMHRRKKRLKYVNGASTSYIKYINGDKTVDEHIRIWIDAHPNDVIYIGDVIHHINGNHQDNRPENLEKMPKGNHAKHYNKQVN